MRSTRHAGRRRSRMVTLVAAAAGVTLMAGCGGSSSGSSSASSSSSKPSASESSDAAGGGKKITVDESEFMLRMSPMKLNAGTYTFVAKNVGHATHALEIEGPGVEEKETKDLSPCQSASLTVSLKKGSYTLYCPVDGHEKKGMKVTIAVT
jgi:uncharacterized cupredoxin-like copper-binding protein